MPSTNTATTPPASVLPPLSVRNDIAAKLDDLVGALALHPLMQRQDRHKTVLHTWYVLLCVHPFDLLCWQGVSS